MFLEDFCKFALPVTLVPSIMSGCILLPNPRVKTHLAHKSYLALFRKFNDALISKFITKIDPWRENLVAAKVLLT